MKSQGLLLVKNNLCNILFRLQWIAADNNNNNNNKKRIEESSSAYTHTQTQCIYILFCLLLVVRRNKN